jgi:transcriptional regulator with XRE-family HTH domain
MDILIAFGKRMRILRQAKNISQERLAEISGLHRTYISSVELGKRNISLRNIEKIAKALGVGISQFFTNMEG